jgi:ATP-binding protein involved in chromosome partitioning
MKHALFGTGGGRVAAERLGTTLLGQVPLFPELREGGDKGRPIVVDSQHSPASAVFQAIAESVLARLAPRM